MVSDLKKLITRLKPLRQTRSMSGVASPRPRQKSNKSEKSLNTNHLYISSLSLTILLGKRSEHLKICE